MKKTMLIMRVRMGMRVRKKGEEKEKGGGRWCCQDHIDSINHR